MTTAERKRGRPAGRSKATKQRMQDIIEFVRAFPHDYAPTLTEIALGVGMKASDFGNVQVLVSALIEEGFLTNAGKHQGRSITVSTKPPRKFYHKEDSPSGNAHPDLHLSDVQVRVLQALYIVDGQRPTELAKYCERDVTSFTPILDEIASLGLIVRRDHPTDRRAWCIYLTAKGKVLAHELSNVVTTE